MTKIIDTANDTTHVLPQLKAAGVETIIRYITRSTDSKKCVQPSEAKAIAAIGLKLGLVFEEWGGSNNFSHGDINATSGTQHGLFAKSWAANVGAPDGTIIWFAIDNDVSQDQFGRLVRPYFTSVKAALGGKYRTGIYGCGFVCEQCLDSDLADAAWLSNAMGWNGSKNFRATNRWHLLQGPDTHLCGLDIDPDDANENDYGAFVPFQQIASDMPSQSAVEALIAAIQNEFAKIQMSPTSPFALPHPAGSGAPTIDVTALNQMLKGLGQLNDANTGGVPPNLTLIDKVIGGPSLVGLKTPIAIVAYAVMWIMQSVHTVGTATGPDASTTGQVLTALIAALGGLGLTSKVDRGVQALSALTGVLQKLGPPPSNQGRIT